MIEIVKYYDTFNLGLAFTRHDHGEGKHCHIWIDLGVYCIEITFGGVSND